ncbi:MAG: histidinol dehydrogenase [Pirellulaceae bacterium]|nr:histidinol dehydrogenase [Planctomycetales bacterium]
MNTPNLNIQRFDTRHDNVSVVLQRLRQQLSPRGDVVSEAGRKKTMEVFGAPLTPAEVVQRICQDVREQGLAALLNYTQRLDHAAVDAASLSVSEHDLRAAHDNADPEFLATIRRIRRNIVEFQTAILHQDVVVQRPPNVTLRQRYTPLQRAGLCVPGGAAAYPSTVLMTAVPAQVAGVQQLAVVAPPTNFGANNPDILAVCYELGIHEVYRVGGAQAVAALAYGVDGMPKVDKIVGPGNLFVALAKKQVYGEVDIDSIAGPSEVVVIADDSTRADFAAADLLAQAEHAPGASILISWSQDLVEQTVTQLNAQVQQLSRCQLTVHSLEAYGALILCRDEQEACELTNEIAPEHLHIATEHAHRLCEKIVNAGATFLGNYSPVALGDYAAGPSHVLPTSGTARWASGLSANHFLRSSSVIEYSAEALGEIAADIGRMAEKEQLTAHRASVTIRK